MRTFSVSTIRTSMRASSEPSGRGLFGAGCKGKSYNVCCLVRASYSEGRKQVRAVRPPHVIDAPSKKYRWPQRYAYRKNVYIERRIVVKQRKIIGAK
jgi:hypothetical protein